MLEGGETIVLEFVAYDKQQARNEGYASIEVPGVAERLERLAVVMEEYWIELGPLTEGLSLPVEYGCSNNEVLDATFLMTSLQHELVPEVVAAKIGQRWSGDFAEVLECISGIGIPVVAGDFASDY